MSAPREVTPAEALPFTLVKRTQAPGAGVLPRATGCQRQRQLGYQTLLVSAGMGRDKTAKLGRVARPPTSGYLLWKAAVKTTSHSAGIFFAFLHLCLNPQEVCSWSWHSLHRPNTTPASVPARAALQKLILLCMVSDNNALHRFWPFFAPKHKC